jgi:hypothetical protein
MGDERVWEATQPMSSQAIPTSSGEMGRYPSSPPPIHLPWSSLPKSFIIFVFFYKRNRLWLIKHLLCPGSSSTDPVGIIQSEPRCHCLSCHLFSVSRQQLWFTHKLPLDPALICAYKWKLDFLDSGSGLAGL